MPASAFASSGVLIGESLMPEAYLASLALTKPLPTYFLMSPKR